MAARGTTDPGRVATRTRTEIHPTGAERHLGVDELIVSKTDPKGVITYANTTFLRMAAYREEEVIGRPHSVVRHPDMPRCVFHLLWETITAGEEIFAYVVNLAGDGTHYWVFAHVTPTHGPDGQLVGYHSNRRAPHPQGVRETAALYRQLRQVETSVEHGGGTKQAAIAASREALHTALARRSMTFSQFVWSITPDR